LFPSAWVDWWAFAALGNLPDHL